MYTSKNQIISSAPSVTKNTILKCLAKRLLKAYKSPKTDSFFAVIISNEQQPDESKFVNAYSYMCFRWSIFSFWKYCRSLDIPSKFICRRVVFATMEYKKKIIKVHSNLVMADGERLYRSSGNIMDRSLGDKSCDTELGVFIDDVNVIKKV